MPKRNGHGIDLLADPTRRSIVAQIALGIGQPSLIAKKIGLSRPATSRQLRLLRQAGLISVRRHFLDGRRFEYFIRPPRLGQITAWLAGTEVGRAFPSTPQRDVLDPSDGVAWVERSGIGPDGGSKLARWLMRAELRSRK